LRLPDAVVALKPEEARTFTAPLDLAALPEGETLLGAVVMEALQGSVTEWTVRCGRRARWSR